MRPYKDRNGKEWCVTIDLPLCKQVKAETGYDLLAPGDGATLFGGLLQDHYSLFNVLYVLCREQCQAAGISDEEFGRTFDGDTLERAADAFTEELIDFFPQPRRLTMRKLIGKAKRVAERMTEKALAAVDEVDPETIDLDALARKLATSSATVGALSAS